MNDREKTIKSLENLCVRFGRETGKNSLCLTLMNALCLLKEEEARRKNMLRSWQMIKHSVLETAANNADAGNEDFYKLLTWVANMMNQQEAKWDD